MKWRLHGSQAEGQSCGQTELPILMSDDVSMAIASAYTIRGSLSIRRPSGANSLASVEARRISPCSGTASPGDSNFYTDLGCLLRHSVLYLATKVIG